MEHGEGDGSEIIHPEIVDEMESGAPWEWAEVRPVPARRERRVLLPALLFVATCLSTFLTGVLYWADWNAGCVSGYIDALRYAVPVMTILLCHEMGHFIQARRYGVYASYPYFLPMPGSLLGTLGAVIRMDPRIGNRKALFDIGITGPLAGLVPTVIFLVIGLQHSKTEFPTNGSQLFGDPLLFTWLANLILGPMAPGEEVMASPMAFAGWVGLLVTSLNLIPIGQLDGGHVLYALLRQKANRVAALLLLTAVLFVAFNFRTYGVWTLFVILLTIMGPIHPPTADDEEPLGIVRTVLGWLTLAFIVVGFTPTPFKL